MEIMYLHFIWINWHFICIIGLWSLPGAPHGLCMSTPTTKDNPLVGIQQTPQIATQHSLEMKERWMDGQTRYQVSVTDAFRTRNIMQNPFYPKYPAMKLLKETVAIFSKIKSMFWTWLHFIFQINHSKVEKKQFVNIIRKSRKYITF